LPDFRNETPAHRIRSSCEYRDGSPSFRLPRFFCLFFLRGIYREIILKKQLTASQMGKLGGPARAKKLSPERRREIASKAGKAGVAARKAKAAKQISSPEQ
jgi:hypothetical protein